MQGWRKRQEDSHINDLDIGPSNKTQLFGVFDGHGGNEVAKFVQNHFTEEFLKNPNYLRNDPKKALEETYDKMDTLMLEKEGIDELLSLYKKSKEEASSVKENNRNAQIEALRQVIDPKEKEDAQIAMFTGCTANVLVIQDKKLYWNCSSNECGSQTIYPCRIKEDRKSRRMGVRWKSLRKFEFIQRFGRYRI